MRRAGILPLVIGLVWGFVGCGSTETGDQSALTSTSGMTGAASARTTAPAEQPSAELDHPGEEDGGGASPKPPGHLRKAIEPARVLDDPDPFASGAVMLPLNNEWLVADHRSLTAVDAGGDPYESSTGVLFIYREDFLEVTQTADTLRVKGSGPVTITQAPLGADVVTSAQASGKITFTGDRGVEGVLNLSDDSIRILED